VRSLVLAAASVDMTVFWNVQCGWNLLMVEAVGSFETSVLFYQTTRYNTPEDSHIQLRLCL
jgi:hypothetical protein